MEVEVLGPLTMHRNGERCEFGGPREQAVLACLVIRAGEVVSTEALVRGVWSAVERPERPNDAIPHLRQAAARGTGTRPRARRSVNAAAHRARRLPPRPGA